MAQRPEFVEFDVGTATLGALSWPGITGAPAVVAVHGITSNAWVWDPLAHHLSGAARLVAVDLRGRGRSVDAPPPYGIRQHADDIAAIIAALGGPLVLIGHSSGASVVQLVAEQHPALVRDVVLVDGGTPLDRPADDDMPGALDRMLGADLERIRTTWPDRVSYHSMWATHPAFVGGIGPDLERNLLADLIECEGGFRMSVSEDAVLVDGREMLADDGIRTLLDRRSPGTRIIRAERGMIGELPGVIAPDVRDRYPQHRWFEAPGCNHYTVLNSADGASLVARVLRDTLIA